MKKEVVEFICDNCRAPAEPIELTEHLRKLKVFFPLGWIGILRMDNLGPSKRMMLCTGCDKAIHDALKERRLRSKYID